jgi:MSHA pilin protein MshA
VKPGSDNPNTALKPPVNPEQPSAWSNVMRNRQSGFTMIELIMVIVILGILAAIAMPRFVDLSSEAKSSALSGVTGAAASAMAVNYATCVTTGNTAGAKCKKVDNCDDTPTLLQGNALPSGYTIAAAALGTGAAGSNGVEATCTITQTAGGATATFTGISAGN